MHASACTVPAPEYHVAPSHNTRHYGYRRKMGASSSNILARIYRLLSRFRLGFGAGATSADPPASSLVPAICDASRYTIRSLTCSFKSCKRPHRCISLKTRQHSTAVAERLLDLHLLQVQWTKVNAHMARCLSM